MRLRQDGHEELQVHGPTGAHGIPPLLLGSCFAYFAQESKGLHPDKACTMFCEATASEVY